jgi:hypothetical protein
MMKDLQRLRFQPWFRSVVRARLGRIGQLLIAGDALPEVIRSEKGGLHVSVLTHAGQKS